MQIYMLSANNYDIVINNNNSSNTSSILELEKSFHISLLNKVGLTQINDCR